jgi:2-(1,2-epoxy-1,2-dihydrophenyl)acetyl-CoA isomerase
MPYETILLEINNGVATITLNRPDSYNALTTQMYKELTDAFKQISRNKEVRAVLLTGAGKGFCSGADLNDMQGIFSQEAQIGDVLRDGLHHVITGIRRLEKPVICAINGVAAGAGASIALATDLRVASDKASFVFAAFINIGLIPDAGSTHFLPQLVGPAKAFELAMLADSENRVSPEVAQNLGIVTKVVAHDELMNEASALANKMANMPTRAIGLAKRAIYKSSQNGLDAQLEMEAQMQTIASRTSDFQEGVMAFVEKRPANFKGE